jgi:hypothetical protein
VTFGFLSHLSGRAVEGFKAGQEGGWELFPFLRIKKRWGVFCIRRSSGSRTFILLFFLSPSILLHFTSYIFQYSNYTCLFSHNLTPFLPRPHLFPFFPFHLFFSFCFLGFLSWFPPPLRRPPFEGGLLFIFSFIPSPCFFFFFSFMVTCYCCCYHPHDGGGNVLWYISGGQVGVLS